MKECIIENCKSECDKGRKYCHKHYLERRAEQYKQHRTEGWRREPFYKSLCKACGAEYKSFKKNNSGYCPHCRELIRDFNIEHTKGGGDYEYSKEEYKKSKLKHRALAAKSLGYNLKYNEVVHHIDGNPKNNVYNNLLVVERGLHKKLHHFLNQTLCEYSKGDEELMYNIWKDNIYTITIKWMELNPNKWKILSEPSQTTELFYNKIEITENLQCKNCGKPLEKQKTFCSKECYNVFLSKSIPSKEELCEVLKNNKSLLQVSKHFGVSDNAIRKWLKKYKLNVKDFGYNTWK